MRSVLLPGKPLSALQAVCTGEWTRKRIIAYISGTALTILSDIDQLLQTIYHDSLLSAVAISEHSGRIAVCQGSSVYIYRPNGQGEGYLKWLFQTQVDLPPSDGPVETVSWGGEDELLVGSNTLTLWSVAADTTASPKLVSSRRLANRAKLAILCPDASLAASIAEHDRLVKVWRRIAIGNEDTEFDFSYLPHPRAVECMFWRSPVHPEQTIDNVLFTVARDNVLRVWAPVWPHDVHVLHLWASVDLTAAIPDFLGNPDDGVRNAFVIDSRVFTLAAEAAVATGGDLEKDGAMQTLVEVANRTPEVVVVFDGRGRMSAWGLENVGCRTRKTTNVFSIVHAENSGMERLGGGNGMVQFYPFVGKKGLVVLAHFWDGRICWMEASLDCLLDPKPRKSRLRLRGIWSGHSGSIKTMARTAAGKALVTSTDDNEHLVWSQYLVGNYVKLRRQSLLKPDVRVRRVMILERGRYVITLHENQMRLWDTKGSIAEELERCEFDIDGKVLCLLLLPEGTENQKCYHIAAVTSEMMGISWEIKLPDKNKVNGTNGEVNGIHPYMREFARFDFGTHDDLSMLVPVDPVGWNATLSGKLDMFSREVATSVSHSGLLRSWTVKIDHEESSLAWLATSTVNTGTENPSLAKASSMHKVAVVDSERSELTIWDSRAGQLEYRKQFETHDLIRDLDWTSTPQSQSILAVGFPHRVLLMCQLRYDYLNAGPAWAPFREISIRDMTPHPIGDSIWLSDGGLVIGSGNQIFIYPRKIEEVDETLESLHLTSHSTKLEDVFDIVEELNGPLPAYHPQFLQQAILAGKTSLVETILERLYKELRNYHEEIGLDQFLGIGAETFFAPTEGIASPKRKPSKFQSFFDSVQEDGADELSVFDVDLASSLSDLLKQIPIPHLTGTEQMKLTGIVECVAQVNEHRRSIDENGARYLLSFRQHAIRRDKTKAPEMAYRDVAWAFHSDSQEILVDLVNRNFQNRMLWTQARETGIFMWLRDHESVKRQFESLARNQYTMTDEKNPIDCSLHYLALKKKNVLLGLWRMASWNREQATTMRLLGNNFGEQRWRTAAMKNAYALLGKHRFEYAAAFFLLADSLKDAVNVCLNHMHDIQLAIAITRVYEGDNGPVLKYLLESKILPLAAKEGDRWLATWAFWMLKRKDMAVRALLSPIDTLLLSSALNPSTPPASPDPDNRLFLQDDPALILLYKQIREKTLQALRGAEKITPQQEFGFVLHTARIYDRMGCDWLALDLVRNWEFLSRADVVQQPLLSPGLERRGLGRRRSSFTVVDEVPNILLQNGAGEEKKEEADEKKDWKAGLVKPPVAVFQEPDMSWAFD